MVKAKKTKKVPKKIIVKEVKGKKCAEEDVKKPADEEEETEKGSGTLSDGVLDAFEEVAPVDGLILEEEEIILKEDEEDEEGELDSGDFRANDEW